jgi:hypothetical protein
MDVPEALDAFLAVDPRDLDDPRLGERIVLLDRLARRVAAAQADAVRVFDARDAANGAGSPTAAAWLREHTGATERDARGLVALGRSLDRLPLFAAALRAGDLTAAHLRLLAAASRRLDPAVVASGEPLLVHAARRLDATRFAIVVRRWLATVAPAEFERDTERRYDDRWLSVSETFGGMYGISGLLDPENGALVKAAIDALVRTNPPDDLRTREQQRADALAELASVATAHAALPVVGGHRPEVVVTVPAETVEGRPGAPFAELADVGPVRPAALDRLSCDARLRRLLVDAAAVPLELGRASRVVPPSLRKFVALRDGGCRYPGCSRGAAFCEAHHVVHWRHGGPTDAGNLVLLCRYHHHLVHDRGHALVVGADGTVEATRPDGRRVTSRARGPTALQSA